MGIIFIDMHLRDERVLDWIKEKSKGKSIRLTHEDIAHEFKCHRQTALAIIKRLQQANLIQVEGARRGGMFYKVNNYASK